MSSAVDDKNDQELFRDVLEAEREFAEVSQPLP